MKHYLQPAFLSPPPALEITELEYLSLQRSRPILDAAFSFEENYDLLVGNYLEIEKSALSITTSAMARQLGEYHEMFELRAEMNRRAVNFLSSARLFVDQLTQRVRECGGEVKVVSDCLSAEYDACFEYRFMEALRNHVQHSGSAVHSLSIGGKWVQPGWTRNEFALKAFTQKRFLELDSTFKKMVLQECPDQVDILNAIRRYLESLSKVHAFARKSLENSIEEARGLFQAAIDKYVQFSGSSAIGLTAFTTSVRDPLTAFPVFLEWDEVRIKLSQRNHSLTNLSKSVITSVRS